MVTLFEDKNVGVFSPYDGVEFIYSILQEIGYYSNFKSPEARRDGLLVIQRLFDLKLIEVFHWGNYEKKLKNKELSTSEKMIYIQNLWFIGASFEDFHSMPMFKYKDWYIEKLEAQGMTQTTDWEEFVATKIGDLEKWIEKNRPQDE